MRGRYQIIVGDCRQRLAELPEQHFHCVVTSPPYFGLRDYGVTGQIGLEPTPDEFVAAMVEVFRGVWRVLRDDGVLWLNLGDSYARHGGDGKNGSSDGATGRAEQGRGICAPPVGMKEKDLCGIPWMVAFALRADGWYLRQDIIWHKRSPMPESVRDRCTKSHEYIFLLTKSARYFYDAVAVAEASESDHPSGNKTHKYQDAANIAPNGKPLGIAGGLTKLAGVVWQTRNRRSVWTMSSEPFAEAHFATYPRELPMTCIKAGTSERGCCPDCGAPWERVTERTKLRRERPNALTKRTGDNGTGNHCANTVAGVGVQTTGWRPGCACGFDPVPCRVLDPFNGAGTTGVAACTLGRDYTGIELNPEYAAMSERRIARELNPSTFRDMSKAEDAPLFGPSNTEPAQC